MNQIGVIRIVLVAVTGCTATAGCEKQVSPEGYTRYCQAPNGAMVRNLTATVKRENSQGKAFYYLGTPTTVRGGNIVCNLPEHLQKEGLKVEYSGYQKQIKYPQGIDPLWAAIELTDIQAVNE